jgi:hypothetical protein
MIYDGLSLKFTRPANINRPVLSLICPVPCSVKLANLFFSQLISPTKNNSLSLTLSRPHKATNQHHYHLVIVRKRRKIGPSCDLAPLHLHLLLLEASMAVRLFHLGSSPHRLVPCNCKTHPHHLLLQLTLLQPPRSL